MNVYHVTIDSEDDWYCLHLVEDQDIYTQAKTLDEAVLMIRDVLDLMKDEKDAELRLIIPADLPVDDTKVSGRINPGFAEESVETSDLGFQETHS